MKYAIEVTQEDIKHGERGLCRACPIAKAAQRALGVKFHADCDVAALASITEGGFVPQLYVNGKYYDMPFAAYDFMQRFDKGFRVSPFSFEIELPETPCQS